VNSQPLVSVVTPVHNGEAYLAECIESVLAQTYQNWDYTIVDNCSTDRSREVAQRYAEKDSRIRVVATDRLVDVMKSQNTAFRQVSPEAEYCKMLHADDWMFSNCLEQMVALAEANPSVGLVGAYRLDGVWVELDGLPFPSTVVPGARLSRWMLGGGPRVFGSPSALLYRARYVRRRGEFFDEADFHADVAACYEILRDSDFGFVHQVLTFTRTHPGEQSSFAVTLRTYMAGRLRHLVTFGPACFSPREYEDRVQENLANYYRFLAKGLTTPQGLEILRYHRNALERMGYRFDWRRLVRAILPYWWYGIRHPLVMARLLSRLPATLAPTPPASAMPKAEEVADAPARPVSEGRTD
jgi:glycosyltransferase involved in cell wall biosynthesis